MGIKTALTTMTHAVGDGMANMSQLNDSQLREMEAKKAKMMTAKDRAMNDAEASRIAENHLQAIQAEVFRSYLPQLNQLYVPVNCANSINSEQSRVLYFDITRWVIDSNENNIEKLSNVYQVLHGEQCNIALLYNRTHDACKVTLAVSSDATSYDPTIVVGLGARLRSAIAGNFPGAECEPNNSIGKLAFPYEAKVSVAAVSNLATEKSEKFISQSIEKLLDGLVPTQDEENYTLMLLARPVNDTTPYITSLHNHYSAISPFAQMQKQFSITESASAMSSANLGGNIGVNVKVLNVGGNIGKAWNTTEQV